MSDPPRFPLPTWVCPGSFLSFQPGTHHPYRPRLCPCGYEAVYGPWCAACTQAHDPDHLSIIEWDSDCE